MLSPLTQQKFLKYKDSFYKNINKSPATATFLISAVTSVSDFTDFTGDSDRVQTPYVVKCLFTRNFTDYQRAKYGLEKDVKAVIYLSPKHLVDKLGDWKLKNFNVIQVNLFDNEYQINNIIYREPLYNSCISVEIHLTDLDKGGK